MGRGDRTDDKKGRRRLLYLRIGLVYAPDQRVYQFVSGLQGEPFDEELVNLVFRKLEAHVPCELALTKLVHSSELLL